MPLMPLMPLSLLMTKHPFLSDQHDQVREMVRDFAENEVRPVARRYDLASEFPWESVRKMSDLGLLGAPWSEELGGSGMDTLSYIIIIEEMARIAPSHSTPIAAPPAL